MQTVKKELLPFLGLFIVFNTFFLFSKKWLAAYGLDADVLMVANMLFCVLSIAVYFMQKKAAQNSNPNVFVRSVMGGTMIKMAVCLVALAIYVLADRKHVSKMSVFAAMFLYLIYLVVEVKQATRLNKNKNA